MSKVYPCVICGNGVVKSLLTTSNGYDLLGGNKFICFDCAKKIGVKVGKSKIASVSFMTEDMVKKKYEEVMQRSLTDKSHMLDVDSLEDKLVGYIVPNPGINTKRGEVCYIDVVANAVNVKNAVIGNIRTTSHVGKSKRGIYSGSGASLSTSIRGNVSEKHPGRFYVTNKRMIMVAPKFGFEIPLDKITTIDFQSDGLIIYSEGKSHIIETQMVWRIKEFLSLNNEYELAKQRSDKEITENNNGSSQGINGTIEQDKIALLREYKSLLDDGVITQEEFEKKKTEILK